MPQVRDLARVLESFAPPGSAQSYDNVGLQLGDPEAELTGVITALDLVPAVVEEAAETGANCIVTHHPLLFKPIKKLVATDFAGKWLLRMAKQNIAYYACHTNIDAARGGVSFVLAETIGLQNITFLGHDEETLYKLVSFVPASHLDIVREALAAAGAGHIGAYEACAFTTPGTGYFRPTAAANPFLGKAGGELERVEEMRLEVEVPRWHLDPVLRAMKEAHPYEEVAYDLYPVKQTYKNAGLGAVGTLPEPELLSTFLRRIAENLNAPTLRYVGDDTKPVQKVAVCGGAGASFLPHALRTGADAYLTADLTYHRYFEALDANGQPRIALVDAGHYETEAMTESLLVRLLSNEFPTLPIRRTRHCTSPIRSFALKS